MEKNSQRLTLLTVLGITAMTAAAIGGAGGRAAQAQASRVPTVNRAARSVPGQVLLYVPASFSDTDVAALADQAGCVVAGPIPYSPHYYVLVTKGRAAKPRITRVAEPTPVQDDVRQAVEKLQQTPGVLASPNFIRGLAGVRRRQAATPVTPVTVVPNDPLYPPSSVSSTGERWHMALINMPQAWAIQSAKAQRTIRVAVMDTGLDINHPDLKNKVLAGVSRDVSGLNDPNVTTIPVVPVTSDFNGHGTHVAGTIAAEGNNGIGIVGVAGWSRSGVDVKVFSVALFSPQFLAGGEPYYTDTAFIAGLNYAVQQNADVVNMSIGGPGPNPVAGQAVTAANAANVTMVAAAGNDANNLDIVANGSYPAQYPEIINVTAVGPDKKLAIYSNFGGNVAIAGPGGSDPTASDPAQLILSTWPTTAAQAGADNYPISPIPGYATIQGTSMATPHVTGAVALLLAAGTQRSPARLKSVIQSTATVLDEVPNNNGGNNFGAGLLNVYDALRAVGSVPGFTAQFAEIIDAQTNAILTPGATTPGTTTTSGSAPFVQRNLTYSRTQDPLRIRYIAGSVTGLDPKTVIVEIQRATYPNAPVQTFVGGVDFNLTPPAGTANEATVETTIPRTQPLRLPDGAYRAVLIYNGAPQGYIFFNVAARQQTQGRVMFASPFLTTDAPETPELTLFGPSTTFTLSRWNSLRASTDLDYAQFTNNKDNPRTDAQARLRLDSAPDGQPISTRQTAPGVSIAPIGLGYWLDIDQPNNVFLTPTGPTINEPVAVRLFAANSGWNMIGTPFTYAVNWSAVTVAQGGRNYSLMDAIAANLVSGVLVGRASDEYVYNVAPAGVMEPFNGYWVRAYQDVTLIIPPTPAGNVTQVSQTTRASHLPAINGWRARLRASVAGDRDGENYFGEAADAEGRANRYDIPKPPAGGGHAYLRFVKPDRSGRTEWYALDMRPTSDGRKQEWNAAVSTDRTNADVTLSWDGLGSAPKSVDLFLVDVASGAKVSLRNRSSYTFRSGEAGSTRVFKIAMEPRNSAGPLAITNVSLVGGRAVQGVNLRLMTTREANVEATVKTLSGRRVATFGSPTRSAPLTGTTLHWSGRGVDGASLPAGAYLIEVTARGTDGETATVKQVYTNIR
jgi:subtilisin family serine protease